MDIDRGDCDGAIGETGVPDFYPHLVHTNAPLPRSWHSSMPYLQLSQENLVVTYKGPGKNQKDAAAARTDHPIPVCCGLYYFEVTVTHKGKEGYIAVGLGTKSASLTKLPGWDRHSYGYHGDDGWVFGGTQSGCQYGPKFSTGDVIGCCVDFSNQTCFFTLNGVPLGVAFTNLPTELYPIVGLNTPGEEVIANFGDRPFVFDITNNFKLMKQNLVREILSPVPDVNACWEQTVNRVVLSHLIHHGHLETAHLFAKLSSQSLDSNESLTQCRRAVQELVLSGQVSSAVETVKTLYPGLLDSSDHLYFYLLCRQFVEMVAGVDDGQAKNVSRPLVVSPQGVESPSCQTVEHQELRDPGIAPASTSSVPSSPAVIHELDRHISPRSPLSPSQRSSSVGLSSQSKGSVQTNGVQRSPRDQLCQSSSIACVPMEDIENELWNTNDPSTLKHSTRKLSPSNEADERASPVQEKNVSMTCPKSPLPLNSVRNRPVATSGPCLTSPSSPRAWPSGRQAVCTPAMSEEQSALYLSNEETVRKLVSFGSQVRRQYTKLVAKCSQEELAEAKQAMEDAFSLLAYENPWSSPMNHLLDPSGRESVCEALNGAILEHNGQKAHAPLATVVAQAKLCLQLMSDSGVPATACLTLSDFF